MSDRTERRDWTAVVLGVVACIEVAYAQITDDVMLMLLAIWMTVIVLSPRDRR